MNNGEILSPALLKLQEEIKNDIQKALNNFWDKVSSEGTPLIENIEGDEENLLVTVLWKQDRTIDNIFVFSEAFGGWMFGEGDKKTNLYHLENTDIWYRTTTLSKKARCFYFLVANVDEEFNWKDEDVILDPFNSKTYTGPIDEENPEDTALLVGTENIMEMPEAIEKIWIKERTDNKTGKIHMERFRFKGDTKERRVWIYTSFDYDSVKENNLIVFTDGWEYMNLVEAPKILDNLIGENYISSTCAVFIESGESRSKELICNKDFLEFITETILPWVKEKYHVTSDPKKTIIAGLSLGGQFAAFSALNKPKVFGKVLSQSGAFGWYFDEAGEMKINEEGNSQLIEEYKASELLPIDFYLNIGTMEGFTKGHLEANDKIIKVLRDKGYSVVAETYVGAHIYLDWQDNLANGIRALLTV